MTKKFNRSKNTTMDARRAAAEQRNARYRGLTLEQKLAEQEPFKGKQWRRLMAKQGTAGAAQTKPVAAPVTLSKEEKAAKEQKKREKRAARVQEGPRPATATPGMKVGPT